MSKFKVGEVVVIYAKGKNAGYNGTEATILECFTGSLGSAYILDFEPEYNADGTRRHNGKPNGWYEFCLRKKYDGDEKTTWDSIKDIWTPGTVGA